MELLIAACATVFLVIVGMFVGGCLAMRDTHICEKGTCPKRHAGTQSLH